MAATDQVAMDVSATGRCAQSLFLVIFLESLERGSDSVIASSGILLEFDELVD